MGGSVLQNDFLKLIYNTTAITGLARDAAVPFTDLYVALHSADPGDAGDQTTSEISYTTYARVAVARSAAGWTVTDNQVTNAAAIAFATPSAGTATATHFSVGVAASGASKILHRGKLTSALSISAGVPISFAIDKLVITIATVIV